MYVTPNDVETFMGIAHTDLKVEGRNMTDAEWIDFVAVYQIPIAELIHRHCRVPTFDPTASNALVVEMKSGRGCTNDDFPYVRGSTSVYGLGTYLPNDIEFYLKNLYYPGGTINGVTYPALVVEEDMAVKTAVPDWDTRTERSALSGGDYEVLTEDELTLVRFHNQIPQQGNQNVRMTYYTGYDPSSPQFGVIKLNVLRCFKNFIMLKKKTQEPLTIRAQGARDYQTMFEPFDESHILGDLEKMSLEPYRRFPVPGDMFG
jgi:hypothetical protein